MLPLTANDYPHTDRTEKRMDARQLSLAYRPIVAPFSSDPELTMRREIKLLRIEVEQLRAVEQMLRAELERLGSEKDDALKIKEFLRAYLEEVEQLRESRDYWEQKALHLSALKPHVWFEWCLIGGDDLLKRVLRRFKCWWAHQRQTMFTIADTALSLIHASAVWGRRPRFGRTTSGGAD